MTGNGASAQLFYLLLAVRTLSILMEAEPVHGADRPAARAQHSFGIAKKLLARPSDHISYSLFFWNITKPAALPEQSRKR